MNTIDSDAKEYYYLVYNGEVVPQGRPRIVTKPHPHSYYSKKDIEFRSAVRKWAEDELSKKGVTGIPYKEETPLCVSIYVYKEMPKSWSKKKKKELKYYPCLKKQDLDNFAKSILDSLTGVLWVDDSQIVELFISKKWSDVGDSFEIQVIETK